MAFPFKALVKEDGSAVVEFVILAIPLFLPITIYLSSIYQNSTIITDLSELARQTARAYVTSSSEQFEIARINTVLNEFELKVLVPQGVEQIPTIEIHCASTPCLTPNSKVEATATIIEPASTMSGLFRFLPTSSKTFVASDTQIVDAWR